MIKKRLSASREIISRVDPALAGFNMENIEKYVESLDIADLGDFSNFKNKPSVFTIEPLTVKYEYLVYGNSRPDFWGVFASHVKNITNLDFDLKFSENVLTDKMRDYFPPEVVHDIAGIIIMLANRSQEQIFFTPPAGFWGFISNAKNRLATEELAANVRGVLAKPND